MDIIIAIYLGSKTPPILFFQQPTRILLTALICCKKNMINKKTSNLPTPEKNEQNKEFTTTSIYQKLAKTKRFFTSRPYIDDSHRTWGVGLADNEGW